MSSSAKKDHSASRYERVPNDRNLVLYVVCLEP